MDDTTLHVVPSGDTVEHDTSTDQPDCTCGPSVDRVPRDNGPDGWILVHHALDDRELDERATKGGHHPKCFLFRPGESPVCDCRTLRMLDRESR